MYQDASGLDWPTDQLRRRVLHACAEAVREAEGGAAAAAPEVDLAHVQAHALGIASRSVSALSEADSAAAEAAVGPALIVFSGGTAFNSVAGTHQPLPARPALPCTTGSEESDSSCGELKAYVVAVCWLQLLHTAF